MPQRPCRHYCEARALAAQPVAVAKTGLHLKASEEYPEMVKIVTAEPHTHQKEDGKKTVKTGAPKAGKPKTGGACGTKTKCGAGGKSDVVCIRLCDIPK